MDKLKPFDIPLAGRHLVEASAGTGKTYNITSLFVRCLIELELDVDEILVLTYTKAATAELKERILTRLLESVEVLQNGQAAKKDEFLNQLLEHVDDRKAAVGQLEAALHNFDEASIFTIHSFCQRALQEQSFLSGILFDSELVSDEFDLIQEAVDDWWRQLVNRAEESPVDRAWLNILKEERYQPEILADMLSKGLGKPYLNLSYRSPCGNNREEEIEKLTRLFDELKKAWAGNQQQIQELLLSDAMNGNRYRSTSVPSWIDDLDQWLGSEVPSLNYIDSFDRFSINFIRQNGIRKGREAPGHPFFEVVPEYIEQSERVRSWMPFFKKELLEHTRQQVRDRKLSLGILGYDDLLVLLQEALNHPQTGSTLADFMRNKFPVALVDEFQDTDPIQYDILTAIYTGTKETGLFLIGDPKQSIYSFRGADLFSYLRARKEVPPGQRYGLDRNFRSHSDLLRAINLLFQRQDNSFLMDDISYSKIEAAEIIDVDPLLTDGEQQPLLQFLESDHNDHSEFSNKGDAREQAAAITAESIAKLLNEGESGQATIGDKPVRAKDIAILVRTHKQADMVRQQLEKRSVKSVQYSEKSVFDTDEARYIELLLKAVSEPRNEHLIRTSLATELFPYNAKYLIDLAENEQRWTGILAQFTKWNRLWQEHGFSPMFWDVLRDEGIQQHLVKQEQGERKLTNLLQLGELLQNREKEKQGGIFELIKWLAQKRSDPDKNVEDEQLRLESDEELVRIVTMHRSKGLEYPVVYCPFLWDGAHFTNDGSPFIYHDEEQEYRASLDLNEKDSPERDQHRYWAANEELSEGLRLAYVAMTRAKQYCTIIYQSAKEMAFSPLGYLLLGKPAIEQQLRAKILSEEGAPDIEPAQFRDELIGFIEANNELVSYHQLDEQQATQCRAEEGQQALTTAHRTLSSQRQIRPRSVVSSFSSIMHPGSDIDEERGSDEFFLPEEHYSDPENEDRTIFSFPKGPQAGTCVHNILEDIAFTEPDNWDEVITANLDQFGFEQEWSGVIKSMISSTLERKLPDDIRLKKLHAQDMIKEMEFYFNLESFQRKKMQQIIRNEYETSFEHIDSVAAGFMKGYIDLILKTNGRFYIADYKTNYLGNSPADYHLNILRDEMITTGYDVQYHVYTVALHRYLKHRLQDYDYETHFGGAFYLFLRGMGDPQGENGVYFTKPNRATIEKLDQLFSGEDIINE